VRSLDNKLYVHALLMCTLVYMIIGKSLDVRARIYYKHAADPRASERRSVGFFGARRGAIE
jgi:hypothetical protein